MKKEILLSIAILIGFLSLLWLEKPSREYLSSFNIDAQIVKQISGIGIRLFIIVLAFALIRKFRFLEFSGLHPWQKIKNLQALAIPLTFVVMGLISNWITYLSSEPNLLLLFLLSTLVVGIVEELVFRGLIFPLFIQAFSQRKKVLIISAVLSSILFGLVHFVNLFKQPENIVGISSQVFFATAIGVFFCGLMVRTNHILIPILLHFLVNFSFGAGELKYPIEEATKLEESTGANWNSIIPTTLFFAFIFLGGIYMILKTDKKLILKKLNRSYGEL